ncbi:MAG: pimeloyl-CoA dehydrogenase small subunit [Mesorhizobium sp.]|nr:MAG: pimeloyl-CoA dehydrogenase small subunit [Mesorhizobium sp.]
MDMTFTMEQKLLRESAEKMFQGAPLLARLNIDHPDGYDTRLWSQIVELGWLAVGIPEEFGGIGGGAVETAVIMEEVGRNLLISPYAMSAVATQAIVHLGSEDQKALLAKIAAGEMQITIADVEGPEYGHTTVATMALDVGGGYRLTGRKTQVQFGATADAFIVSANLHGTLSLFLVEANAEGLSLNSSHSLDLGLVSDMDLDGVELQAGSLLGKPGEGVSNLRMLENRAIAAACAEASGAMQALVRDTVEYTKTRKQFGAALSTFQALQHRLVDMFIRAEFARSMALLAAFEVGRDATSPEADHVCSAAKYLVMEYAKINAEEAIQLHGAMGMARELPIGHFYKRIVMLENLLGCGFVHLGRMIEVANAA